MSYLAALNSGSIEAIDAVVAVDVNLAEVLLSGNNAGNFDLNMNDKKIIDCYGLYKNLSSPLVIYNDGTGGVEIGNVK